MKKVIILLTVLCLFPFLSIEAAKESVYMTTYKTGHAGKNTTVRRSPMNISLGVTYDDISHQIYISNAINIVASVTLLDGDDNFLDYYPSCDMVIEVPADYKGVLKILIESNSWISIGMMEI